MSLISSDLILCLNSSTDCAGSFGYRLRCLGLYSRLQLLTSLYNSINEAGIMNIIVIVILDVQIISFYILIVMRNSVDEAICVLLFLAFVDTLLFVLVVFGRASKIYPLSVSISETCRKVVASMHHGNMRKFLRKVAISWARLKIRFFCNNYFDQLTPLILEKFSFDTTVSLILVGKMKWNETKAII